MNKSAFIFTRFVGAIIGLIFLLFGGIGHEGFPLGVGIGIEIIVVTDALAFTGPE